MPGDDTRMAVAGALLADLRSMGLAVWAEGDRLLVRPVAALDDEARALVAGLRHELQVLVEAEPPGAAPAPALARRCADCMHLARRGTCLRPEAAGLFPTGHGFGIAWPPLGHGAACPAWVAKPTTGTDIRQRQQDAREGAPRPAGGVFSDVVRGLWL